MRCNSGRVFNNPTIISIFNRSTGVRVRDMEVPLGQSEIIQLTDPDPCISNPPLVCYVVGNYNFVVDLPASPDGYIVAGQVNFRVAGIANLVDGYSQVGATYTAEIPGTGDVPDMKNNSAKFVGSDLVIVCANNSFSYSFAASDPDKDELRYSFCEAYRSSSGPSGGFGNNASPPLSPPYAAVPYGGGYNGSAPLGTAVRIDSKTGLITGIAPSPGIYVVTVCVEEIKNGKVIAIQRKDLQIAITSCSLTAATLEPEYLLCRDSKTIVLSNLSISTLINSYNWQIKTSNGNSIYTSTAPNPSFTFPDTGIYQIRLVINPNERCTDSTTSFARVYPGFKPAFSYDGICFTKPTDFKDATTSVYGTVNSWKWNFGEATDFGDTSTLQNPVYTYQNQGTHTVLLTASDTKGCKDTVTRQVIIFDKPPVTLAFRDTLICPPDQLLLQAFGRGNYTWSPGVFMTNANSATPTVAPLTTTTYYVTLDDDGCINRDSVLIRVTDKVTLTTMGDTTICQGDGIRLRQESNALSYTWDPAIQLDDATLPTPFATTISETVYTVTAFISQCKATGNIRVRTIPYPVVSAGADTVICYNSVAHLHGATDGSRYSWSPSSLLNNSNLLEPATTTIGNTTYYIITATDTKGCPKPVMDTVVVVVLPKVFADAGHDTTVIFGEPLQLTASGGNAYSWYPSTDLSATNIPNPVIVYNEFVDRIHYTVLVSNEAGCSDSASMTLTIFNTPPTVFVPTGFTPNGDGKNDILRPIAVGMKQINRFIIFNRLGQQVFSTTTNGKGWDGTISGQLQQTSSFVWYVEAIDFTGKKYVQKGTVTLIR